MKYRFQYHVTVPITNIYKCILSICWKGISYDCIIHFENLNGI